MHLRSSDFSYQHFTWSSPHPASEAPGDVHQPTLPYPCHTDSTIPPHSSGRDAVFLRKVKPVLWIRYAIKKHFQCYYIDSRLAETLTGRSLPNEQTTSLQPWMKAQNNSVGRAGKAGSSLNLCRHFKESHLQKGKKLTVFTQARLCTCTVTADLLGKGHDEST